MRQVLIVLGGFIGGQLSMQLLFRLDGSAHWAPAWLAACGPLVVGLTFGWIVGWQNGSAWAIDRAQKIVSDVRAGR